MEQRERDEKTRRPILIFFWEALTHNICPSQRKEMGTTRTLFDTHRWAGGLRGSPACPADTSGPGFQDQGEALIFFFFSASHDPYGLACNQCRRVRVYLSHMRLLFLRGSGVCPLLERRGPTSVKMRRKKASNNTRGWRACQHMLMTTAAKVTTTDSTLRTSEGATNLMGFCVPDQLFPIPLSLPLPPPLWGKTFVTEKAGDS